jgi:S1-C subfamily serine protease
MLIKMYESKQSTRRTDDEHGLLRGKMKIRHLILNGLLIMLLGGNIPCTIAQAADISEEATGEVASTAYTSDYSEEDAAALGSSEENPEKDLSPAEKLERVKSSVVQINCVYIDDDGKHHIIKGAPGTLVGKSDGDEYVITGMSSVTPGKDLKKAALKSFGVEDEDIDIVNLKYEVVVQNDIVFGADLLSSSDELNLGVFKLSQALGQRTPMTLLYSESGKGFEGVEDVHAYGFPDAIVFGKNVTYYPNDRVNRISGKVSNVVSEGNVEWIEHNATIADSNSGGPLVTSEGEMVGLNMLKTEGAYFYSISSNSIVKVLDGLGIEYDKISIEEKQRQKEAQDAAVASSTAQNEVTTVPEPSIPVWLIAVIIVLIVLVLSTMMAVVLMMIKKSDKPSFKERREQKKEEKERQITPEQFDSRRTSKRSDTAVFNSNNAMDGTSVLQQTVGGDTSVLTPGSSPVVQGIYGSMFRKQYSENIIINKTRFVIGKDAAHVDYCIKNNGAISRQHTVLTVNGNDVYIEDLGSTNGTFVNGNKLSKSVPVLLNEGDVIRLADEELEFRK